MKIPFGYGNCQILFASSSMPDNDQKVVSFKIDQSSFFEVDEWSDNWVTLARSKEKDIYGYHFNFDLKLYDNDLGSSTQEELVNFLFYYNQNTLNDKMFYLFPYRSAIVNPNLTKGLFQVITTGYPTLSNIAETSRAKGQYLHLKCETKFIIDKDDYNYLMYRETSDDSWGLKPPTLNQGSGDTPMGVTSDNKISDATNFGFKDGDIGDWVVYSDGAGTLTYDGANPNSEKVGKVLVGNGGAVGTYTGGQIDTTDISAFVDGTTYKLRTRVYIPSANNNFTEISILPVNLAGWTKVSEILATLTTEDEWQTVEAIYTAAADIAGAIAVKGKSTTDGDIFYIDDIEIANY